MEKSFKTTLSNGLRVLLLENHAAPVVSFNLWCNVGSVNEEDNEAGICHLIEHMIFKGTGRRPVGQIAKEVEAAGGEMNAYTSFDETVFYINMSSRRMDVGLDILADAAADPTFDGEELTREKEVVVEEISRSEDNPGQMVSQDLFSKAFSTHPYRRPIAGSRETVRGISRAHLLNFYKRWYVGSNLIFIGVGDFQKDEILSKIETLFAGIPAGSPPSQNIPEEPLQMEARSVTRAMAIEGRYLDLAVPIPNLTHPDVPALDLLSHILGGGESSRLEQAVKEKKGLVSSISSYPYTPRYPGLLVVGAVLKERALKETLQAVWQEIERLKTEPPSAVEFARARENIRSARVYERQTVEAMARKLGYFEGLAHDLQFEEEYYRRLAEVTPEEIRKVAEKYLLPERTTLSFCHPQTESWPVERLKNWLLEPAALSKPPRGEKIVSGIHLFRLSSGVRLLVKENRHLPLIALRSASLGGMRQETAGNNGISHLISLLATKGTAHRTAREISEEIENLSAHMDGYLGRNLIGLHGSFLSERMIEGMELFFDLLLHPSFPEEEIRKEKGHTVTAIRNEKDSLPHLVMKQFLSALYPRHPYGLPTLGTTATVKGFTRKELVRFYREAVRPQNLVLSVVGDVDAREIRERMEEKLRPWRLPKGLLPSPPLPKPPSRPITVTSRKKKKQAHLVYGFLGTTIRNPDHYAMEVMNSILAGQGGRLFLELRDKQGLAYAISSGSQEGIEAGYFAVYMGTDPQKLETAIEGIRKELKRITEEPVSGEELERAKRFLIGNYALDLQRNESVASLAAYNEIYGLGREELFRYPEKIERVTREDILRAAKRYLRQDRSVLSVIKS
jgi:zinc protease